MEARHITLVDDLGCELVRQLASSGPPGIFLVSTRREAAAAGHKRNYYILKIHSPPDAPETWAAEANELRVLDRLFKQFVPGIPRPFRRLKYHDELAGRPGENAGGGLFRLPGGQDWDSLAAGWPAIRDFRAILGWLKGLGDILQGIHEAGAVHGSVNPGNLLWDKPANTFCLIDFTAAAFPGEGAPRPALVRLPYTSPERLAGGEPRFTDDIYALGITLCEWLTGPGKFPVTLNWTLEDNLLLARQLASALRSFDAAAVLAKGEFFDGEHAALGLLPPLAALIQKCLHPDPARRYQKVAEILADLHQLESALPDWARRPAGPKAVVVTAEPGLDEAHPLAAKVVEPPPPRSAGVPPALGIPLAPVIASPPPRSAGLPPALDVPIAPIIASPPPRSAGVPPALDVPTAPIIASPKSTGSPPAAPPPTSAPKPAPSRRAPLALVTGVTVILLAFLSLTRRPNPPPPPAPVAVTAPVPITPAPPAITTPSAAETQPAAETAARFAREAALRDAALAPGHTTLRDPTNPAAPPGGATTEYRMALAIARDALATGDFARAVQAAGIARADFPGDAAARTLQTQAQDRLDQFRAATNSLILALQHADYPTALNFAATALVLKPGDPQLLQMQTAAQSGLAQQTAFHAATNQLQLALGSLDYTNALAWSTRALALAPADPAITQTRADIQLVLTFGAPPPADARTLADGRVCSPADPAAWTKFTALEVLAAQPPDTLLCRPFHWQVSVPATTMPPPGMPVGRGIFPGNNILNPAAARPIRKKKYAGPPLLLLHYESATPLPAPGSELTAVSAALLPPGTIPAITTTNLIYDCGLPWQPPATFAEALARAQQRQKTP